MNSTQTAIAAFFVAAPTAVMPLLDRSARLDMIDLYEARMEAVVGNRFGGTSTLEVMSDSLLQLCLTEVSDMTIRLTPDSLLELTRSIDTPEGKRVSTKLYTTDWKRLPQAKPGLTSSHKPTVEIENSVPR